MRSKLLAAVLACSAVFGLASCGAVLPESSSETETTTGTAAQRVIETTKTATMGDDYDAVSYTHLTLPTILLV